MFVYLQWQEMMDQEGSPNDLRALPHTNQGHFRCMGTKWDKICLLKPKWLVVGWQSVFLLEPQICARGSIFMGSNINKCYEIKNLLRIPLKAQISVSKEGPGVYIHIFMIIIDITYTVLMYSEPTCSMCCNFTYYKVPSHSKLGLFLTSISRVYLW